MAAATLKKRKKLENKGGFSRITLAWGDFGAPIVVQNELADIPDKMLVEPWG